MNNIKRALSALNHLDSGCQREEWIRIGMAAKTAGLTFDDFHNWSKNGSNYANKKDCYKAWESFKTHGGVTSATLFGTAIQNGWLDNANKYYDKLPVIKSPKQTTPPDDILQKSETNALEIWDRCLPAQKDHDYILRKNGKPHGLRYYPSTEEALSICGVNITDYLVVPCWSDDVLQTLQFISPKQGNKKLNLKGASFNDGFFTVGIIEKEIYICEGLGQAWAINNCRKTAVVCFGAGRMKAVAKKIREKHHDAKLIIVPDKGKEKLAAEIANDVSGYWIEIPGTRPANYDVNDYMQEFGSDKLDEALTQIKIPEMRFKLLSSADLSNAAPMQWLIKGVLPAEGIAALYGPSGSGKSFLTLDMACAIAIGDGEWFGHKVIKTNVVYICLEGEAGIGKRIKAWSAFHGSSFPKALKFVTQHFDLLSNDILEVAKLVVATCGLGSLIIIDTLNRAAPGADENSSVDMGNIIANAKRLQHAIGGLVLLVHHTGKDTSKGLRGHSSLYAALDGAIEVTKSNSRLEWNVSKSKDDVTGLSYPFKLEVVQIEADRDGEMVTSCSIVAEKGTKAEFKRLIPPKSGNQKIIWDALSVLLSYSSDSCKAGAPLGRPCIRVEEAIEKTKGNLLCEKSRQYERTQKALSGLITRGLLEHREGWLWIN